MLRAAGRRRGGDSEGSGAPQLHRPPRPTGEPPPPPLQQLPPAPAPRTWAGDDALWLLGGLPERPLGRERDEGGRAEDDVAPPNAHCLHARACCRIASTCGVRSPCCTGGCWRFPSASYIARRCTIAGGRGSGSPNAIERHMGGDVAEGASNDVGGDGDAADWRGVARLGDARLAEAFAFRAPLPLWPFVAPLGIGGFHSAFRRAAMRPLARPAQIAAFFAMTCSAQTIRMSPVFDSVARLAWETTFDSNCSCSDDLTSGNAIFGGGAIS